MGFGILFVGYLFAFGFTSGTNYVMSLFGIMGTIFLFRASRLLSRYTKRFSVCVYLSAVLFATYIFNAGLQILEAYSLLSINAFVSKLAYVLLVCTVFVYNLYMYLGISDIALIAENKKVRVSALRNLILMVIYYISVSFGPVIYMDFPKTTHIVKVLTMGLGVIWLILNIVLVLSAYMRIGTEGEEEISLDLQLRK